MSAGLVLRQDQWKAAPSGSCGLARLAAHFRTDHKVALVSIRSVGQQTEEAFLDLVEKEEQRGFARIYQNDAA